MKKKKYINLIDTEIDKILDMLDVALFYLQDGSFCDYILKFYEYDFKHKNFDFDRFGFILFSIYKFIFNKKNRLRVRNNLKFNKSVLYDNIFSNLNIKPDNDDNFWLYIMFDFINDVYEVDDYNRNSEHYYKEMYYDYLKEMDNKVIN